ncbi:SYT11 [Cordylochernes scorpioides]|uniref:SYT11 n=1 Tax=Cordylochernes scorpioides TaxID=51811 RepID=A0ABY6JZ69_9ARAC|nr:SYT11 [Cordylochernes scorpioides]
MYFCYTPERYVSSATLVGICLGSVVFLLIAAAVGLYVYGRRFRGAGGQGGKTRSSAPVAARRGTTRGSPPATLEVGQTTTVLVEHERVEPCPPRPVPLPPSPLAAHLGQLHFKLRYDTQRMSLQVTVLRCAGLPPDCDPYVKLQLLPDKIHRVKTRVLRKTSNPAYEEDFTFYGLSPNQFQATTLHFVVLSFDRYSRDDVIGEVVVPLRGMSPPAAPLVLCQDICPRAIKSYKTLIPEVRRDSGLGNPNQFHGNDAQELMVKNQGRGELLVSLCYQPGSSRLTVVVLKAQGLPRMDLTGACDPDHKRYVPDPYVKLYLLYHGQRIAKKKTHVKRRTTTPVFNESFIFEVPYQGPGATGGPLAGLGLELLVLDRDRVTKNEVVGRVELGPHAPSPAARQHWTEAAESPRRQIAEWHRLGE